MDGAQQWQLYVKDLVGTTTTVSVRNPQVSCVNTVAAFLTCCKDPITPVVRRVRLLMQDLTVLGLKQLIHEQRPDLPPYKQKLVCRSCGPRPLEDGRKLASVPGLHDKSVINLIVQMPWELYVQTGDGKLHAVEIPSSTPNVSGFNGCSLHESNARVPLCLVLCFQVQSIVGRWERACSLHSSDPLYTCRNILLLT